ncbi:MAG: HAD family phosphatase [Chloroflexi bacterium]|nr:HAD family phosphatase [Chloroflexota bacterium]
MARSEPRAVIWDVDGTLVDSLECHWQAWCEALAHRDYVLSRERFESIIGQKMDTALRSLLGPDLTPEEIRRLEDIKETRCRDLMRAGGIALLPGVTEWLDRLRDDGWRQGVASSAPGLNLTVMLGAHRLERYFGAIVCAEDVARGKPDPEPFVTAAERLGVDARRCIVVEDAAPGIEGARRAGMRTIGVGPGYAALRADVTVPTLADLPEGVFGSLLGA